MKINCTQCEQDWSDLLPVLENSSVRICRSCSCCVHMASSEGERYQLSLQNIRAALCRVPAAKPVSKPPIRDDFRSLYGIYILELPSNVEALLLASGIHYVGDLMNQSIKDLIRLGIGMEDLDVVISVLSSHDRRLRRHREQRQGAWMASDT
jgi:hypothetical protein